MLRRIGTGPIATAAAGSFALQVSHTGIRFLISVTLARFLGAGGYGAYSFTVACVGVLCVPALLGFDAFLVREIADSRVCDQWSRIRWLIRRAILSSSMASVAVAVAAAGVAWALSEYFEPEIVWSFLIGLTLIPLTALLRLLRAIMIALKRAILGQVPETLVQPLIFATLLGAVSLFNVLPSRATTAVGLSVLSTFLALLAAVAIKRNAWPREISHARPEYASGPWMRSAGFFVTISGLHVVSSGLGIIMLGSLSGAEAAGIFGIANAAASLITLPLMAINTPLAPAVSASLSRGDRRELQRLASRAARGAFALSMPIALLYVVFGEDLLQVFGPEFEAGYTALVVLAIAQVFNAGMGSVGVLLQMTGHERDVTVALGVAVFVNFLLNIVLIPLWGVHGAALGAAANIVLWNVTLLIQVRRRLAIHPTVLAGPTLSLANSKLRD